MKRTEIIIQAAVEKPEKASKTGLWTMGKPSGSYAEIKEAKRVKRIKKMFRNPQAQ